MKGVVICFQISIFEPLETTIQDNVIYLRKLWFAFKLVSLNHWKQRWYYFVRSWWVVICFQISIFEPLETTEFLKYVLLTKLWFAFKLVSLNHWKQPFSKQYYTDKKLWFAFKLVSLNHWKQLDLLVHFLGTSCDLLSN